MKLKAEDEFVERCSKRLDLLEVKANAIQAHFVSKTSLNNIDSSLSVAFCSHCGTRLMRYESSELKLCLPCNRVFNTGGH